MFVAFWYSKYYLTSKKNRITKKMVHYYRSFLISPYLFGNGVNRAPYLCKLQENLDFKIKFQSNSSYCSAGRAE